MSAIFPLPNLFKLSNFFLFMPIKIDFEKCCWKNGKCCSCGGACVGCVEACPVGALKRKEKLIIDKKKCIECGVCVLSCKHNAISLKLN